MRFKIIHNAKALSDKNCTLHRVYTTEIYHKGKNIDHYLLNFLLIFSLDLIAQLLYHCCIERERYIGVWCLGYHLIDLRLTILKRTHRLRNDTMCYQLHSSLSYMPVTMCQVFHSMISKSRCLIIYN